MTNDDSLSTGDAIGTYSDATVDNSTYSTDTSGTALYSADAYNTDTYSTDSYNTSTYSDTTGATYNDSYTLYNEMEEYKVTIGTVQVSDIQVRNAISKAVRDGIYGKMGLLTALNGGKQLKIKTGF